MVNAVNAVGIGSDSVSTSIIAGLVPNTPAVPILATATSSSVSFTWTAPTNTGESPIIGYNILWNSGSGSVYTILSTTNNIASLAFTKTTNILGGVTYAFKV